MLSLGSSHGNGRQRLLFQIHHESDNFSRLCRKYVENSTTTALSKEAPLLLNAMTNELEIPSEQKHLIEKVHNYLVGHFGKERTIKLLLKEGHTVSGSI